VLLPRCESVADDAGVGASSDERHSEQKTPRGHRVLGWRPKIDPQRIGLCTQDSTPTLADEARRIVPLAEVLGESEARGVDARR
jgi:hypothetical protein